MADPVRELNSYWGSMTAEQRSEEMKRRRATAKSSGKLKKRQANSRKKHCKCKACDKKFDTKYQLANHVRYAHPKKGTKRNGSSSPQAPVEALVEDHDLSLHIHFAFGSISKELTNIASGAGISRSALALGVAELLRHSEGR